MFTKILYGAAIICMLVSFCKDREKTKQALKKGWKSFEKILPSILCVLLLIGMILSVLDKNTISKLLGAESGILGMMIAAVIGSIALIPGFAAGPLYASFPVAGVLLKKGASFTNVFIFIGAWSTTKIPMMLFEITQLGGKFTLIRFAVNVIGIVILSVVMEKTTPEEELLKCGEK